METRLSLSYIYLCLLYGYGKAAFIWVLVCLFCMYQFHHPVNDRYNSFIYCTVSVYHLSLQQDSFFRRKKKTFLSKIYTSKRSILKRTSFYHTHDQILLFLSSSAGISFVMYGHNSFIKLLSQFVNHDTFLKFETRRSLISLISHESFKVQLNLEKIRK